MSGGKVHVEHQALAEQASRLKQSQADLQASLQQIQSQIQQLVSGGFVTDSASGSFAQAQEKWNTSARTCVDELEVMSQYLTKASAAFADVDQAYTVKF